MNRNTNPGNWWDFTWNPITGCLNGCPYCYARRFAKRQGDDFTPKFHPERLAEPAKVKKPSMIFACSMGDYFGKGIRPDWRRQVFEVWRDNPRHTFVVLTKRVLPPLPPFISVNVWMGVSLDRMFDGQVDDLDHWHCTKRILCLEPMLEDLTALDFGGKCDWLIIGGQSRQPGVPAYKPPREQIDCLIAQARGYGIPVWVKDNAGYPLTIRERP